MNTKQNDIPKSWLFRSKPSRLLRLIFKFVILLYSVHLGWLFGHRFLMITHRGRITGRLRQTVLEVVQYDPAAEESIVVSGWGSRADWYRNIMASPALEVQTGWRRFVPEQRLLSAGESAATLTQFRRSHPWETKIFSWLLGLRLEQADSIGVSLLMISFRPASADLKRSRGNSAASKASSAPKGLSQPEVLRVFQSKNETKAFYNKISKVYDLLAEKSEEPIRKFGLKRLGARSGEKILEIGFGTGHSLEAIARAVGENGKVYGIDISDEMLKIARERVDQAGLGARVETTCGDAATLPYESDSMDAVFMTFTLELFDTPDIVLVLAECRRVLRPGGRIVVVGMSKEGNGGTMVDLFEWTHQHFPNYLDCRPIYVQRALEEAGLKIETSDKMMMWIPVEIVLAVKEHR